MGRIWKLHEKCHEEGEGARTVCEHFEGFFDKLGMYGTIGNEGIMTKNYLLSRVVEVPEPSMTTIG